ncbi:MAG: DNA methyltransferase [Candidatus Omnitrophica bacterium]|nr:DNA methyltransferase [Candidatus Omnitrophota bacterium]
MEPYYQDDYVTIYHGDCREIIPQLGTFDLLMMDPPYGIGEDHKKQATRGGFTKFKDGKPLYVPAKDYGTSEWDYITIEQELINTLIGMAKYSCMWGGNYYRVEPAKCWLVWDKENTGDFADGELAWTNYPRAVRIKRHLWNGMLRKNNEPRVHPTQKPLEVITWAISLSPVCETILDPFAGSGTTGRAAKDLCKKCVLIEQEERWCEKAALRMAQEVLPLGDCQ